MKWISSMFNKKFSKLVKEHPERFEYDFETSTATGDPKAQTELDAEHEKKVVKAKKILADRKMAAEKLEDKK